MSFPSVKIAGALKGTFGIQYYKSLTTNFTNFSHAKRKKKLHQYCETCLLSTLPSCHQTVVLCPMLDFPCPQAWKEDHFVTMSYGRAHHILLSKCHSKAVPTPEKPEQHGYVAVCILLMNSHVSCFRKPFLLYSCHFHGIKDSPRPFGC